MKLEGLFYRLSFFWFFWVVIATIRGVPVMNYDWIIIFTASAAGLIIEGYKNDFVRLQASKLWAILTFRKCDACGKRRNIAYWPCCGVWAHLDCHAGTAIAELVAAGYYPTAITTLIQAGDMLSKRTLLREMRKTRDPYQPGLYVELMMLKVLSELNSTVSYESKIANLLSIAMRSRMSY